VVGGSAVVVGGPVVVDTTTADDLNVEVLRVLRFFVVVVTG
jgi:hypothetical protein